VEVYTCDGLGPVTSRLAGALARQHTVLQGRHQELALLQACATRVRRGQGQVVCLVGDAGMGKSRVAYECQQRLADVRWLTMQALSYGQAMPYHAVLPLLRTVLGVVETEPPAQQYQMLQTRLAAVDPLLVADAPLLAHVLGVPLESEPLSALAPDAQRQRLQHACLRLLLAQAADTPLGLLVEDGHWLDPSSQELLDRLVAALARRPVFLLCTARPGFRHFWADHTYFHQVAIEPLTGDETHALLRDLLQPYDASPDLHAWLHARTGGNPFFVEELVRTLRAHALLTVQGAVYEVAPAARGTLPDSIQGLVQARLDRLPAAEKRLVQVAAVVGPAVPLRLLEVLAECPTEAVHHGLAHLQSTEFLDETGFGPDVVFTFKHALTQDAVYQSLLRSTRQQVHQRIAQVLAERFPETAETQPELLAQHYTAAGLHAQSLPYWQRALKRSANREAAASLEKGLEAVPHLPQNRATLEQAVDLRLALRSALLPSGDSGRLLACLREAETLAATLDDPRRLGQISRFLSHHFYQSGAYDQAIDAAHRALALATAGGDVVRQALANQSLGYAYYSQGVYRPAIDCFGQLVLSLDGAQRRELFGLANLPAVAARVYLASCHAELGTFAAGSILGEEGLQIAEEVGHPSSLMIASLGIGLLSLRQGNLSRALPALERAMDICHEADLSTFFPWMAAALGAAYTLGGRVADAVPLLTQALEQTTATEMVRYQALCSLCLGEAQMLAGHLEEAYTLAEQTLGFTRAHQEGGHQAYALRLLGDIATQCEPPASDQAEVYYQQALVLAEALGMRPLVAHCHHRLGQLYHQIGRDEQARTALTTAIDFYRAMEMTFWLPQAKAVLAQVEE
jgi:tetratricopeptide (TPR) repeat protein